MLSVSISGRRILVIVFLGLAMCYHLLTGVGYLDSDIENNLKCLHGEGLVRDFRREVIFRFIRELLPSEGRCMDIGCGTGYMTERIADLGFDVTGIDSSETLIHMARERIGERDNMRLFVSGVQEIASFGQFETLVCLDVLEHLQDDNAALRHLFAACCSGGKLIISVPALPGLFGRRDAQLGHFRRYMRQELVDKVNRAGFQTIQCKYWNMIGAPVYWFSERMLHQSINDSLRTGSDTVTKRAFRHVLSVWLSLEMKVSWLPWGLSLLMVARK